jgi:hypothetical protein
MEEFNLSKLFPNNRAPKVGLYPLGEWIPGVTRAREPMVPQNYMRRSKASSFMNMDTDSHANWLRDPITGVWHKRSQGGLRDFLPSGADVTMRCSLDPTELPRVHSSPEMLRKQGVLEDQFMSTAQDFGRAWGSKMHVADWRASSDKKMFDPRASGSRVL